MSQARFSTKKLVLCAASAALVVLGISSMTTTLQAQEAAPAAAPATKNTPTPAKIAEDISVELNKLETQKNGCRVYVVINNQSQSSFKTLKLDMFLFRPDGIVGRNFAVDLAPLKPSKRSVKLFDLNNVACDQIASVLINDALECKHNDGTSDDNCLARLSVSSRAKAQLAK